uniref:Uncharacterized protein n=1 Tax=Trichuris muris TaxID=70415 RepID=A0A5S6R585_TRIMR
MECPESENGYLQHLRDLKRDLMNLVATIRERILGLLAKQCPSEERKDEIAKFHGGNLINQMTQEFNEAVGNVEQILLEFSDVVANLPPFGEVKSDEECNDLVETFCKCHAYVDELCELFRSLHLPAATIKALMGNLDASLNSLHMRLEELALKEEGEKNVESILDDIIGSVDPPCTSAGHTVPEGCFNPLSVIRETLNFSNLKWITGQLVETEWKSSEDTPSGEPLNIVLKYLANRLPSFEAVEVRKGDQSRPDLLAKVKEDGLLSFVAQLTEGGTYGVT